MRSLLIVTIATITMLAVGCAQPGAGGAGGSGGNAATPAPADAVKQIVNHAWWKVRPSEGQVKELLAKMQSQQANTLVYFDESFRFFYETGGMASGHREMPIRHDKPETLKGRHWRMDMANFRARPSQEELTRAFLKVLDEADYKCPRNPMEPMTAQEQLEASEWLSKGGEKPESLRRREAEQEKRSKQGEGQEEQNAFQDLSDLMKGAERQRKGSDK